MKEQKKKSKLHSLFEKFASKATEFTGSTWAFLTAVFIVIAWAVSGPIFGYSETWQLVINTGTTIITFLMVFLIQKAQNKDSLAIQVKLNEVVASLKGASNRMIDVESLSEDELRQLHTYYTKLATLAQGSQDIQETHSIEEAQELTEEKINFQKNK